MAKEVRSVCDLISRWALEIPDHPAILFGSRTVTYRQLDDAASRIASIVLDLQVQPGDLVPVLATRSCEMVASFLGVLKAGACYVPIDIEAWADDHIVSTLKRVSARVVINLNTRAYPEYHEISLREIEDAFKPTAGNNGVAGSQFTQANIKPMDLAYIIFTSGTTSTPKGVMIPHRALLNYVQQGDEEAPFNSCPRPEDKSLLTFSPGFDACAGVVFSTLCNGAQLIVAGISEFESCASQATIIAVTPSMLSAIHDVEACSHLRLIIIGGEAPNQRLVQRWSAPGRTLYNGYGPTETTISSLMGKIVPSKPITLGRPMKNSRVLLLDGDTESDYGEICITGPGLAAGYYHDEALTSQKFIYREGERVYRTGDFARRTEHGLEFAGRADSFVKNRGFLVNIDSQVIPILLGTEAHTATAFMNRDRLVAFVTPEDVDTLALRQSLLRHHDSFLVPDQIRAVPVLPLTVNGKVDNRALRQLLDLEVAETRDMEKANNGLRQHSKMETLKMAISAATSLPQSKILDERCFLDQGGNSLAALKVLAYLRRRHLKLKLKDLFDLPDMRAVCDTIQELEPTAQIEKASEDIKLSKDDGEKNHTMGPMTALQTKMIQASLKVPGANCFLLRIRIPHPGKSVSALNLKSLWHRVLSRHAIFRTKFLLKDELQKIDQDLYLDWSEEKTTLEQQDEVIHARSLEIRNRILSSGEQFQLFTPVNAYHLITVEGVGSTLLVSAHHAQADGWSFSIILEEVQEALLNRPPLQEEPPQFLSIALAQKEQQTDPEGVSFWTNMLKNHAALPTFSLPKPPPYQIPYEWTSSLTADLNLSGLELGRAARDFNVTPSALLYTAWSLVLSNYTSSDRVAFGVVFSGRNITSVSGVEHVVGPLLNTVPFPIEFEIDQTVQGAVSAINNSLLQMLEFQWSAAEAMKSLPGESINGTLQTLVVTEYDLPPTQDLMSWSIEREDLMEFGLTLLLEKKIGSEHKNQQDQELQARILFDNSRYAQSAIERLLNHFKNALFSLIKPQHTYMKEVRSQLMGKEEKSIVLQAPNAFEEIADTETHNDLTTIKEKFEAAAMRWPQLCAIESPYSGKFSYQEVDELADRVAVQLIQRLQTKSLDNVVVGVLSDGSVYWVIAILAVLKAGYICCPLDISLPLSRIKTIIQESGASVFLAANRTCRASFEGCDIKVTNDSMIIVDEFLQQTSSSPTRRPETATRAKDTIYLVFTSGSTGVPKGVPLHNVTVLNAISVPALRLSAAPGRRISQLSALGFDMVLIEMFGSLCYGATLVLKDPSNPFEHIKHVNAMVATPSFLSALAPDDYCNLDTVLLAGEPVTQKIADVWSKKVQTVLNVYGPSECGCASGTRLLPGVPVKIGRPLPGLKFYVLDHHKCLVPQGITGEIYISGDQVIRGYWGSANEIKTKSCFISNPFDTEPRYQIMYRTGDMGFWDEDMNISYVGRVDNQVKVRGFRVELEEVENALIAAGGGTVQSAAAIAIGGSDNAGLENHGLRIVGFVTPASVDIAALNAKLSVLLPTYSRPSETLSISELPTTPNLKLDREKLRNLVLANHPLRERDVKAGHAAGADSLNLVEKVIAEAWRKVLGLDGGTRTIKRDDDFISLGGNSILAIKSARLVAESIGHDVPIALLLRETTLGHLAQAIDHQNASDTTSSVTKSHSFTSYLSSMPRHVTVGTKVDGASNSVSRGHPLSHLEMELFQAHAASTIKSAFNIAVTFLISGPIDVKKLAEAFLALIQESPILRARYIISEGIPLRHISSDCSAPQIFVGNHMDFEGLQLLVNKPFDLANEQLIRVILWNQNGDDQCTECLIVMHHIITDKASLALLLEGASRKYKDLVRVNLEGSYTTENVGRSAKGTYIDWAWWLAQQGTRCMAPSRPQYENRIRFWKEHLQRTQQPSSFSGSLQTQHMTSYSSNRMKSTIPPLNDGKDENVLKHKYSQRVAVAATVLSLHAHLGSSDLILGVPYLNRDEPGTAGMLGLFVDRLPIRVLLNDTNQGDADELLNGISAEINLCIENQLPYIEIQSAIAGMRNDNHSLQNLIDVMIVYDWQSDSLRHSLSLGTDVQIEDASDTLRSMGSMYPLEIMYTEKEDGSLDIETNFDAQIISPERMAAVQAFLPDAVQGLARQRTPASIVSAPRKPSFSDEAK